MKKNTKLDALCILLLAPFIYSCSTAPKASGTLKNKIKPADLLTQACMPGSKTVAVSGVVWLKAKSSEAAGQFPANIEVTAPDKLRLEVETPFGGTYAILTIQGGTYKIVVPGKPEKGREGKTSWGGIPLKWATDLFLGRIPCLDSSKRAAANVSISDDDELVVEYTGSSSAGDELERFVYLFDESGPAASPKFSAKSLHWEKHSDAENAKVDFEFSNPDPKTLSPLRWQAKSAQGEVKIHWTNREIIDSKAQLR